VTCHFFQTMKIIAVTLFAAALGHRHSDESQDLDVDHRVAASPSSLMASNRYGTAVGNDRMYDLMAPGNYGVDGVLKQERDEEKAVETDEAETRPGDGSNGKQLMAPELKPAVQTVKWDTADMSDFDGIVDETVLPLKVADAAEDVVNYVRGQQLGGDHRSPTWSQLMTLTDTEVWDYAKLYTVNKTFNNMAAHVPLPVWRFDQETITAFDTTFNAKHQTRVAYIPIFVPKKHSQCADGSPPRPGENWWENVYLPGDLRRYEHIIKRNFEIEMALNPHLQDEYYAYLTLDPGVVEPGKTQRVAGWHTDGFQGQERAQKERVERNYIATNRMPTLYANDFVFHLSHLNDSYNIFSAIDSELRYVDSLRILMDGNKTEKETAAELIDKYYGQDKRGKHFPRVVREVNGYTLYYMDGYTIHGPDRASHLVERVFYRLQFAVAKYDRTGPTDNPLLCGGKPLFDRKDKPSPRLLKASDHPLAKDGKHPYHQFACGSWYEEC